MDETEADFDDVGAEDIESERRRPEPIVVELHIHHHFDGPIPVELTLGGAVAVDLSGTVMVTTPQVPTRIGVRPGIPTTQAKYL